METTRLWNEVPRLCALTIAYSFCLLLLSCSIACADDAGQDLAIGECARTETLGQQVKVCRDVAGALKVLPLEVGDAENLPSLDQSTVDQRLKQLTEDFLAIDDGNANALVKIDALSVKVRQYRQTLSATTPSAQTLLLSTDELSNRIHEKRSVLATLHTPAPAQSAPSPANTNEAIQAAPENKVANSDDASKTNSQNKEADKENPLPYLLYGFLLFSLKFLPCEGDAVTRFMKLRRRYRIFSLLLLPVWVAMVLISVPFVVSLPGMFIAMMVLI
jgi:hypothetical protein